MTPPPFPPLQAKNSLGRSNIFPSQSNIITSNSVQAGLAICDREVCCIWINTRNFLFSIRISIKWNVEIETIRKVNKNWNIFQLNFDPYPSEPDACDSTAKHVSNDRWIRLGCRKIRVKFRAMPVCNLDEQIFCVNKNLYQNYLVFGN